tara:strand:- start:3321 stop:3866 length:546 start_codon:yes stop_codon:yes gene_type:complete
MAKHLYWPGEKNEKEETRFQFRCTNVECKPGREKFHAVYDAPGPVFVPSGIDCPWCEELAKWCMEGFPATNVVGSAGSESNPHYSPQLAEAEHKWMANQIEEAKCAVDGDDQIEGKAASPYAKRVLNHDKAVELGIAKRRTAKDAAIRNRLMDERSKDFADQNIDKLTRVEKKHAGRRSDG